MKCKLIFACLILAIQVSAQTRRDTIFGVAMVIDTAQEWGSKIIETDGTFKRVAEVKEILTTELWPSASITEYILIVDSFGFTRPRIQNVQYYRLDNCDVIPFKRLLIFKQQ